MKKALPNTITVRWEDETGEPYLLAEQTLSDHGQMGEKRRVGIYKLDEVRMVEGVISHTAAPNVMVRS